MLEELAFGRRIEHWDKFSAVLLKLSFLYYSTYCMFRSMKVACSHDFACLVPLNNKISWCCPCFIMCVFFCTCGAKGISTIKIVKRSLPVNWWWLVLCRYLLVLGLIIVTKPALSLNWNIFFGFKIKLLTCTPFSSSFYQALMSWYHIL